MAYRLMSILMVFSLSGCAISPQMDSVRKVADQKKFQGLDEEAQFSISFPSSHSGPYKSVDQLNFVIKEGRYSGKNASALLVKSQETGEWEVLNLMIEKNGSWVDIPQSNMN